MRLQPCLKGSHEPPRAEICRTIAVFRVASSSRFTLAVLLGGTATRADRAGDTIDLIEKEIRRFADGGPTAGELTEAKKNLNSAFALNLDSSTKIAALLVQLQLDGLDTDYFTRRSTMIEAVTLDDARRVAKRLLDKGLLVTVVGKPQGFASSKPN